MKNRIRTQPDFSTNSLLHQVAKSNGIEHFYNPTWNVADEFKNKSIDEVKQTLQSRAFPYAVCFEHWSGDFNMATGIRNANAFNAEQVYYVGDKKWDRRGSVGTHNYTEVTFINSLEEFMLLKNKYIFVGIDNIPGSVPLSSYQWQPNTLLIFGEEGTGLTPGMQALCKDLVYIEQFGSVRSLNCGTASGIIMNDFVTKWFRQNPCRHF